MRVPIIIRTCSPGGGEDWAGLDSNQRRLAPMGLQPIPFSHSGTDPYKPISFFYLYVSDRLKCKIRPLSTLSFHLTGKMIVFASARSCFLALWAFVLDLCRLSLYSLMVCSARSSVSIRSNCARSKICKKTRWISNIHPGDGE